MLRLMCGVRRHAKHDAAPGPQSIWQGLMRVKDFAMAWHAFGAK
jgi:hypothetical protein